MLRFANKINNLSKIGRCSVSFLNGGNTQYIEQLYNQWNTNPGSVDQEWDSYFKQVTKLNKLAFGGQPQTISSADQMDINESKLKTVLAQYFQVRQLINLYRMKGHQMAKIDPLELDENRGDPINVLDYFTEADLDKEYYIYDETSTGVVKDKNKRFWKLRDLVQYLEKVYCGHVSYEYMHINNVVERDWIRAQIENYEEFQPSKEQRIRTFDRLCHEYSFSMFLQKKFTTSKRFGIEGLDSMISGLHQLVDVAAQDGVQHIAFGMAHRGRLNTLYSVFQKSGEEIMMEFQDLTTQVDEEQYGNSGDVKYHLGQIHSVNIGDKEIKLEMLPNPSHLEAVDPLVYGKVRAIQDHLQDKNHEKCFGVLIHGDAALSGQGIVYESLNMAELDGYKSGGMIHIVANNQIGFTTLPKDSRSGLYCTDLAYTIQAPVIHVNADEPDLVDRVITLAVQYRNKFKKDIFVDLVGYRRFGHNEQDQPRFTQPYIYEKINKQQPVFVKYSQKLIDQGLISREQVDTILKKNEQDLEVAYQKSRKMEYELKDYQPLPWDMLKVPILWGAIKDTGVPESVLKNIGTKINTLPADFNCHPQVKKFYEDRLQAINNNQPFDFATAEALAFGTLLHEGYSVRLSGEDVQRATFSHRHAYLHDQKEIDKTYVPLHSIIKGQEQRFTAYNSLLSEYGVLGFDYGYSITNPNCLVCWEAQFGDFANGAQIIVDNYISCAETKWDVDCGLVLLLPNGMDGQGPEHSSARIERYLQLSDDDPAIFDKKNSIRLKRQIRNSNMQIVQCTTPANYFHALRRQLRRDFRKPLIAFTSKRLLRLQAAKSRLGELSTSFQRVYGEAFPEMLVPPKDINKVFICSGQIYYDLLKRREVLKQNDVAIIRIEQLAPFPYEFLQETIQQYTKAKFLWVQEEHQNYGPWYFVQPRIQKVLHKTHGIHHHTLQFVGRKPSGATASGFPKVHEHELNQLLSKAFEM